MTLTLGLLQYIAIEFDFMYIYFISLVVVPYSKVYIITMHIPFLLYYVNSNIRISFFYLLNVTQTNKVKSHDYNFMKKARPYEFRQIPNCLR